jgi:hypothetical protein
MPYGEGRSERELDRIARDYGDDAAEYIVTTGRGTRITVTGVKSARAVAGEDGTYRLAGLDLHPSE